MHAALQPFIALGMELQKFGHRIRLATHEVYRAFVEGFDLEFFPLGGDPTVLSEYVVRNRGEGRLHHRLPDLLQIKNLNASHCLGMKDLPLSRSHLAIIRPCS